jgi:Tfp pilus tip-associated adhesin PilY1
MKKGVWCALVCAISPAFGDACDDVAARLEPIERDGVRFEVEKNGTVRAVGLWETVPPGIGEVWSVPTLARISLDGLPRPVLIVSGGYAEQPGVGNHVFVLDAETGAVLWVANTTHPVPARVAVIDTDGDALVDRFYVADLGGHLWRFVVSRDGIAGTVMANLGTRQFFQAPDVAFTGAYFNVALGSGDRRAPTATGTVDRFYSIRDRSGTALIADADLVDVRTGAVSPEAAGWKLDLAPGEKVLNESVTANGTILFTTYTPGSACVTDGSAYAYAMRLDTGAPAAGFEEPVRIAQGGLPGNLHIAIDPATRRATCWTGDEPLPVCVQLPRLIRTFWQRGR